MSTLRIAAAALRSAADDLTKSGYARIAFPENVLLNAHIVCETIERGGALRAVDLGWFVKYIAQEIERQHQ